MQDVVELKNGAKSRFRKNVFLDMCYQYGDE